MNNKETYCGPAIKQIHIAFSREKKMGDKRLIRWSIPEKKTNQEPNE